VNGHMASTPTGCWKVRTLPVFEYNQLTTPSAVSASCTLRRFVARKTFALMKTVRQDDGSGLEEADRLAPAPGLVVHHGGHAVVRADLQKCGLELIPAADVTGHEAVRQATFFQQNGHLLAVRGGPVVQLDHDESRPGQNWRRAFPGVQRK
jgi:hypothetical protein